MASNTPTRKNRWYDRDPNVSNAVEMILTLPEELQDIICSSILLLAEKEFQISIQLKGLKSVGATRILSLFKSKKRQRKYDQSQNAYQSINYLSILSEENQQFMARAISEMMGLIVRYLTLCRKSERSPEARQVKKITQTYVTQGLNTAEGVLFELENALIDKVSKKPVLLDKEHQKVVGTT